MSERVLLTGRCERRRHLVFEVVDTPNGLWIHAPGYAWGRDRKSWAERWLPLEPGRVSRFGCPCGRSELLAHADMWSDIRDAVPEPALPWVIAGNKPYQT